MKYGKYSSLAELKRHELEGVDYRLRARDRGSWATVISPHGGFIDAGTSDIAHAVAGRRYNFFDFQGLKRLQSADLHVTATRFRDPLLDEFLSRSAVAMAIHWMGSSGVSEIWLGGLNGELKAIVRDQLQTVGLKVNTHAPRFRGESPHNVVNLPIQRGVQLEISDELMSALYCNGPRFSPEKRTLKKSDKFYSLVAALKLSLKEYEQIRLEAA